MTLQDKKDKFDLLIEFMDAWDYKHGSKDKEVQDFLREMKSEIIRLDQLDRLKEAEQGAMKAINDFFK